jgi:conjugal transfer pilus assembly protein TraE
MKFLNNVNLKKSFSETMASRNMAQVTNMLLGVAVVFLAGKAMFTTPTTVVTPPAFTQEFTIQGDKVSDPYKISWALYVANTIGNTNQRNIDFNKDVITSMLSPNLQDQIGDKMERAAEILRTRKVNQAFNIEDTRYDSRNDIVYVWGKKIVTALRQEPITSNWTVEVQVQSSNGSPKITYLKQYRGNPRVNELKGKVVKSTPQYLSPEIDRVVSGINKKSTTMNSSDGLGHKPDIAPVQQTNDSN